MWINVQALARKINCFERGVLIPSRKILATLLCLYYLTVCDLPVISDVTLNESVRPYTKQL